MSSDLGVGLRLLWKDKAFTLTVALTLALCIGANTALFSIVHHVLLRPLPFPDSEQIVLMANRYPGAGVEIGGNSSAPDYYDRLHDTTVFSEQALYNSGDVTVDENGTATRVRIMNVTSSFFHLLRIPPHLGRTFSDAEGELGNEQKLVLSDALWRRAFGADPHAIRRDMRIDGRPYTIVGVMPSGFVFGSDDVVLWRPLVKDVRRTLYLMWGGALFVLLIGCVNVANLAVVRSGARLRELVTRIALGADRWRLVRQLMTESVLLTLVSAGAGLLAGCAGLASLRAVNIHDLPRGYEIRIDATVVAFTLMIAAAIGVLLGVVPVGVTLPANVTDVLRQEGRTGTSGAGARVLRRSLVITQVAFAFVLLIRRRAALDQLSPRPGRRSRLYPERCLDGLRYAAADPLQGHRRYQRVRR